MHTQLKLNFLSKSTITEADYAEISNLLTLCQKECPVNVKLELDYKLSLTKNNNHPVRQTEFFCYSGNTLISYLGICYFGGDFSELTGLTHPEWREQHIFKRLLKMAMEELKKDNHKKLLLLADHNSVSGTSFLNHIGAAYSFSEYRMRLVNNIKKTQESLVYLKKACIENRNELRNMDRIFYDNTESEDINEEDYDLLTLDSTHLIYNGSDIIGKIRIEINDSYAFISGFVILDAFRSKGFGTKALKEAIALIQATGNPIIELDVAASNDRALHIYINCGFAKQSVMDYYELSI